jgi:hypothetical protein
MTDRHLNKELTTTQQNWLNHHRPTTQNRKTSLDQMSEDDSLNEHQYQDDDDLMYD